MKNWQIHKDVNSVEFTFLTIENNVHILLEDSWWLFPLKNAIAMIFFLHYRLFTFFNSSSWNATNLSMLIIVILICKYYYWSKQYYGCLFIYLFLTNISAENIVWGWLNHNNPLHNDFPIIVQFDGEKYLFLQRNLAAVCDKYVYGLAKGLYLKYCVK